MLIGNADEDRDAVIDQVSAVVDPERHTVPVRIKLDNPDGLLRPNAYVRVRLFDPTPTVGDAAVRRGDVGRPAQLRLSREAQGHVHAARHRGRLGDRRPRAGDLGPRCRPTAIVVQGSILLDNEIALEN